ncbi:MAG: translation elongation factor Ts [Dehalococcoidia bacterium]|nr:translation elongation factor Ts [Dehalococcoidia bacterium]
MTQANVSAADVKALREKTGAGVMECKKALTEAGGDQEKAIAILRERGLSVAERKAHRVTGQGLVECYIHAGGRIGAMVEVNCETDFVARTDDFKTLARDLAMQVAAQAPLAVTEEDLPTEADSPLEEACLLLQPFIRDPSRKVQDIVNDVIAKTGENIRVRRFARFELGN